MIRVDKEKCTGCGSCMRDCFPSAIRMVEQKAEANERCIECGHCVAVCPENAVTLLGYDMNEVIAYEKDKMEVDAEVYLNHLKYRRSIRRFKDVPVTTEEVTKILDAGRYAPTGGNLQNVAYYVAKQNLSEVKDLIYDSLKEMGDEAQRTGNKVSWYSDLWLRMYDEYKKDGTDRLFFNADTVIFISSNSPQSGCIAAAHMETMIYSLGLGMLYSGFTTRAVANSEKLQKYLQLKEGYQMQAVLVVGHPAVKYLRTVPRKPADVIWN